MSRKGGPSDNVLAYVCLGFAAICILVAGVGFWAVSATISGAVVSSGIIALEGQNHVVQHPQGGVVAETRVGEGDFVSGGDVLLRLDTSAQGAELAYLQEQLFEAMARQDRLHAEARGADHVAFRPDVEEGGRDTPQRAALLTAQRDLFQAQRETRAGEAHLLRQRQEQIKARLSGIDAQIAETDAQIALLADALKRQLALEERGLTPAINVLKMQRDMSVLKGHHGQLSADHALAEEQITGVGLEILQNKIRHREEAMREAADLEPPIRRLKSDIRHLQREMALAEIRAPVDGRVFDLQSVANGAVLRPATPILTLIPRGRAGIASLRVRPADIDLIVPGQVVKLRLSALNQRTTPEVFGAVTRIGADTVEDTASGGRFFEVEVTFGPEALTGLPPDAVLVPGMPVEAFVQTGEGSPLDYLAKPVLDYFARAFRES